MADYYDTTGRALTEEDLDDRFDEYLDGYGMVSVAGMEFEPSRVLKELDPIAYRCGRADWVSAEIDDEQLWEECWLVGNNLPGYMPDNEPEAFASWADAWTSLKDDLEREAEAGFDPDDDKDHHGVEADRVLALLASDPETPNRPVSIAAFDRVYWIAEAE